jgi:hypothetical protein
MVLTPPNNTQPSTPVHIGVDSAFVLNDYDAAYTHNTLPIYTFSYHVRQLLFYQAGRYQWETWLYNATDTFYDVYGQPDSALAQKRAVFRSYQT